MFSMRLWAVSCLSIFIFGCGGGSDSTPVNQSPVAVNDQASVQLGQEVTINVLVNDSDPESDSLSITNLSNVTGGEAIISGNQIVYTAGELVGNHSLTYTISDGNGNSAQADVEIIVNPVEVTLNGFTSLSLSEGTVKAAWGNQTISGDINNEGVFSITFELSQLDNFITLTAEKDAGVLYLEGIIGSLREHILSGTTIFNATIIPDLNLNEARTALGVLAKEINGGVITSKAEYDNALEEIPGRELVNLTQFLLIANAQNSALNNDFPGVKIWLSTIDTNLLDTLDNSLPFSGIDSAELSAIWDGLIGDNTWLNPADYMSVGVNKMYFSITTDYSGLSLELKDDNTFTELKRAAFTNGEYSFSDDELELTGANGGVISSTQSADNFCGNNGTLDSIENSRRWIVLATTESRDILLTKRDFESVYYDEMGFACETYYRASVDHAFMPKQNEEAFNDIFAGQSHAFSLWLPDQNDSFYSIAAKIEFSESEFTIANTGLNGTWNIDAEGVLFLNFTNGDEYRIEKFSDHGIRDLYMAEYLINDQVALFDANFKVLVDSSINTFDFDGRFEWQSLYSDYSSLALTFQSDGKGFQSLNSLYPADWSLSTISRFTFEVDGNVMSAVYTWDKTNNQASFDNCASSGGECVDWRTRTWEVIAVDGDWIYILNNSESDTGLLFDEPSNPSKFGYIVIYKRESLLFPPL